MGDDTTRQPGVTRREFLRTTGGVEAGRVVTADSMAH
jgi:hypothetical protein